MVLALGCRGALPLQEVRIPTSRGPEACLAQEHSQLPEAVTPKRAEPWARSICFLYMLPACG